MSDNYDEILKKSKDLYNRGEYVSAVDIIDTIENKPQKILDYKYNLLSDISKICINNGDTHSHLYCLTEMNRIKPGNEFLLLSIAIDLDNMQDYINALSFYEQVLNINKRNYDALIHIALLFIRTGQIKSALKYIDKAKRVSPNQYKTAYAMFKLYEYQAKYKEAIRYVKEMYSLQPNNPDCCFNCARTFYQIFDYNKAIEFCDKTLKFNADDIDILCLKTECQKKLGLLDNVYDTYEELLKKYPNSYTIKRFYASHALLNKDCEKAYKYFPDVHSPLNIKNSGKKIEDKFIEYEKKRLNREKIKGKTILIHQGTFGIGDFIMFSRYFSEIENRAGKVIIETTQNLIDLFSCNYKNITVTEETKQAYPSENYDYSLSCLDILYSLSVDFNNITPTNGWLNIPNEKIISAKNTGIFETEKKKIGLFWRGSGGLTKFRNIDLKDLLPVFENENAKFYSFDIEKKDDEILEIFRKYNIEDCSKYIKNAFDTAAFMKNLDVLITVDSFPLHLAGAIGIKTFLYLPVLADWRWFYDNKTTPWYSSVEIFRQTEEKNLEEVVLNIKTALEKLAY